MKPVKTLNDEFIKETTEDGIDRFDNEGERIRETQYKEGVIMPRTTFYGRRNVPVTIHPNIGLDASVRQSVIKMLNLVLADEAVLSLKTSLADGDSKGREDHELQTLYNAQYQQINAISAEIGERIQILGDSHAISNQDLMDLARLDGDRNVVPSIVNLLDDHEAITRFLREDIQNCLEVYEDQGTFALLVGVMRTHEKIAWILRSNITEEQFDQEKTDSAALKSK